MQRLGAEDLIHLDWEIEKTLKRIRKGKREATIWNDNLWNIWKDLGKKKLDLGEEVVCTLMLQLWTLI